jgi:hypothetical protein
MQADEVAAESPPAKRRIVGTVPLPLLTFTLGSVLGTFIFAWGFLAAPPDDANALWNTVPPVCLLLTVEFLVGTCRIVVDPKGFIDVINLVLVRRIPLDDLVAIEHDDGLRFRLVSGRRVSSSAYSSSAGGLARGYARATKEARRIEAAIGGLPVEAKAVPTRPDRAVTRVRSGALLTLVGLNGLLVAGTVVLNLVETASLH